MEIYVDPFDFALSGYGKNGKKGESKYPWPNMRIGDVCIFEAVDSQTIKRIRLSASTFGRRNGIKLTVKRSGNNVKVWRLE